MATERKSIIHHEGDSDGVITFAVLGAGSFKFDPAACNDETERSATIHGYVQKISDKAAIPRDPKTGHSATPREKYERMVALAKHLTNGGGWTMRAAAQAALNRDALFEAVAKAKNISLDTVLAKWGNMDEAFLRVRLTDRDVAAEYARLTASGQEDSTLFAGLE